MCTLVPARPPRGDARRCWSAGSSGAASRKIDGLDGSRRRPRHRTVSRTAGGLSSRMTSGRAVTAISVKRGKRLGRKKGIGPIALNLSDAPATSIEENCTTSGGLCFPRSFPFIHGSWRSERCVWRSDPPNPCFRSIVLPVFTLVRVVPLMRRGARSYACKSASATDSRNDRVIDIAYTRPARPMYPTAQ
jgi:hypothetical protein